MHQHNRKIEYLKGRIEILKHRKQTLLGMASAAGMDIEARKELAEKLDGVIERLRRYNSELTDLEEEPPQL